MPNPNKKKIQGTDDTNKGRMDRFFSGNIVKDRNWMSFWSDFDGMLIKIEWKPNTILLKNKDETKVSIKLEVSKIQRTCSDLLLQILSKYATILRTSHLLRVEPTIEWEEEIGAGSLNFWDF